MIERIEINKVKNLCIVLNRKSYLKFIKDYTHYEYGLSKYLSNKAFFVCYEKINIKSNQIYETEKMHQM